jgi:hypothetical protein
MTLSTIVPGGESVQLCVQCKWLVRREGDCATKFGCSSPRNFETNMVTGERQERVASAGTSRGWDIYCGREAKWFAPLPTHDDERDDMDGESPGAQT